VPCATDPYKANVFEADLNAIEAEAKVDSRQVVALNSE